MLNQNALRSACAAVTLKLLVVVTIRGIFYLREQWKGMKTYHLSKPKLEPQFQAE